MVIKNSPLHFYAINSLLVDWIVKWNCFSFFFHLLLNHCHLFGFLVLLNNCAKCRTSFGNHLSWIDFIVLFWAYLFNVSTTIVIKSHFTFYAFAHSVVKQNVTSNAIWVTFFFCCQFECVWFKVFHLLFSLSFSLLLSLSLILLLSLSMLFFSLHFISNEIRTTLTIDRTLTFDLKPVFTISISKCRVFVPVNPFHRYHNISLLCFGSHSPVCVFFSTPKLQFLGVYSSNCIWYPERSSFAVFWWIYFQVTVAQYQSNNFRSCSSRKLTAHKCVQREKSENQFKPKTHNLRHVHKS